MDSKFFLFSFCDVLIKYIPPKKKIKELKDNFVRNKRNNKNNSISSLKKQSKIKTQI